MVLRRRFGAGLADASGAGRRPPAVPVVAGLGAAAGAVPPSPPSPVRTDRRVGAIARCMARARICWNRGSRSLTMARIGAAMKIDEYVPEATPMNSANAKSFRVWPPKSSSDPMGSSTTSEVFTDRIRVWFKDMFTTPE